MKNLSDITTTRTATGERTQYPASLDSYPYLNKYPDDVYQHFVNALIDAVNAIENVVGTTGAGTAMTRFHATATITSAAAATPVNLVPDTAVPAGKKCYLEGFLLRVNGATGWGTTANVKIQDTNGTPVDFATVLVALLTNAARVGCEPKSNLTLEDAFAAGTGGTAAKGLQVVGDANGTGSDLIVSVWGVIK